MKTIALATLIAASLSASTAFGVAIGQQPKDISVKGLELTKKKVGGKVIVDGKSKNFKLSDFKNDVVVLEWFNDDCPYVEKHYDSGNMQKLQAKYSKKGVKWVSVVSSAPKKQGHIDAKTAKAIFSEHNSSQHMVLFDESGTMGRYFGAKTTPHMYIVNKGKLVYNGAIDDKPSTQASSLKGAKPLFANALDTTLAGGKISNPTPKPYGCSVKYDNKTM